MATSSAAPPPKPMTQSAPCALKAAAPAITWRAGRVAEDAVEHRDVQAGQVAAELGHHRQRGQRVVGDDQRALAAGVEQVACHQLARAGAELDVVGKEKRVMVIASRAVAKLAGQRRLAELFLQRCVGVDAEIAPGFVLHRQQGQASG